MNVASLDLNLLKAFSALYAERHVTRAANAIGLAQPSMSNALSRLRGVFDDELFVRSPKGMIPTERAEALAPRIDAALGLITDALNQRQDFDPLTAQENLVIATPDNILLSLAPKLSSHFETVGPGFRFRFVSLLKETAFDSLDRGLIDVAIGHFPDLPARFYRAATAEDRFVVIARKGHPWAAAGCKLEDYCSKRHVMVTFNDDTVGRMDVELQKLGMEREIGIIVSQFSVVPHIVASSNQISTLPLSVAAPLAGMSGCEIHPLPIELPTWHLRMIWGTQAQNNTAKKFAINEVQALLNPQS